jgi:hypothetical protein
LLVALNFFQPPPWFHPTVNLVLAGIMFWLVYGILLDAKELWPE